MELYDALFYRKSIKSYSNKNIKQPLLQEIKSLCKNITYLNNNLNIKAHLIERGHLVHFSIGKDTEIKAPHYILVTSNNGENHLQNVGFAIEKLVLELTCLGVGTTWLQCKLNREDVKEFIQLDDIDIEDEDYESKVENPISLLAIGYPDQYDSLFRRSKKSYDRKKMKEICKKFDPKWEAVFEGTRVSPSVKNIQPWLFKQTEYGFDLFEYHPKKRYRVEKENKISMGAALRHFDICCKEKNIEVQYVKKDVKSRGKKEYLLSIIEKNYE